MNLNLNHEGFENYLVNKHYVDGGVQYRFKFENGYGASIIKHRYSYGYESDLWELGVLIWHNDNNHICKCNLTYNTEITDDVIGWLTDEEVRNLLERIKNL